MLNFQRIICIWICCVSCMFGTTQLSTSLVQAVPYEYFDDHDQSFYDLDTEQIQAKYDTRLLSQQILPTENEKSFHNPVAMAAFNEGGGGGGAGGRRSSLDSRKQNNAASLYGSVAKLKSNGDSAATSVDDDNDDDDNTDWLEQKEKTSTMAVSSTSAFTEPLDELYLPRAASCFTNGQKYTHGQKVPRLDNCEVCLCMDGEIFCWWEKCDEKSAKVSTTYDAFSTPFEESSTARMQLNPKTTLKTTLKPMKKPKTRNEDYKYHDDDSAEIREMQQEYEGINEQLLRDEHEYERETIDSHTQKQIKTRNMQMAKKKSYQQQEEEKHKKKIKESNQSRKQQEQQKQLKLNEHYEQHHHHAHSHNNNNNRHHDNGSNGSSSKILNFPENLPSVLYYDYKTEEHHQHQHQHREQHLKHQKQKQQQHEKELKQQQQKRLQQQREQQHHHKNHHHEYGQDLHTYESPNGMQLGIMTNDIDEPSTTFKYFSNGNRNIFNEDLKTDSDILPEPPTKKPKFLTSIPDTTGNPLSQVYRLAATAATTTTTTKSAVLTIPKGKLPNTPSILTSSTPLKKQILSSLSSDKANSDKENENSNSNIQSKTNNDSEEEDLIHTEDQDDAFHRWLTSTETNNKNNFTLKDTISRDRESVNANAIVADSNSDYNGDERIYENSGFDTDVEFSSTIGNTNKTILAMATGSTKNTEAAISDVNANALNENKHQFSDNSGYNGNRNIIINSNDGNDNYNIPNSNHLSYASENSSDGGGAISSTTSNEDNGVASVVNIDIMLTASSPDMQQQNINFPIINRQQQQIEEQLQNLEHEKQIAKTLDKLMQPPQSISNTNDAAATLAVDNKNRLSLMEKNNNNNFTNIVGGNPNKEIQTMGVNSPNNNNRSSINNNNSATSYSSSSTGDSFKFKNSTLPSATASTIPPTLSTTSSPERQCNVMGTLYKIGDILPQDTGNCLQCICIDGSTSDDTPRVTCSPHNCPPLVLPDLFDATGY